MYARVCVCVCACVCERTCVFLSFNGALTVMVNSSLQLISLLAPYMFCVCVCVCVCVCLCVCLCL